MAKKCQHVLLKVTYLNSSSCHSLCWAQADAVRCQPISVFKRQLFFLGLSRKTRRVCAILHSVWSRVPKLWAFHPLSLHTFLDPLCFFSAECWCCCVGGPVNSLPPLSSLSFTKASNEFCLHKQTLWNDHQAACERLLLHSVRREAVELIVNTFWQNKKADYHHTMQCNWQTLNVSAKPFQ